MRLSQIRLHDFRNVKAARLQLEGNQQFGPGPNGQGKTNLLETTGLVTAARSFRTNEIQHLIHRSQALVSVQAYIARRDILETRINIHLAKGSRKIFVDEVPAESYADFIGRHLTVTISSDNIQLLRGGPPNPDSI